MSIDKLQNGIRKLKNPSMVGFSLDKSQIPPAYLETAPDMFGAYSAYSKALLTALQGIVPAVRFAFGSFAVMGTKGLETLMELLLAAKERGFYCLLDAPEMYSPQEAALVSDALFADWEFDGLVLSCYIGSDGIKPFADKIKAAKKDLFILLRTGNKSASELQDLLSGSRLWYMAAADTVKRLAEEQVEKCGYSRIASVGPAASADSLRTLRVKYPALFLLIDGYDYSGANAKNCSAAFDKLGHGAVACAGSSVVAAWQEENGDAVTLAVQAAERMKKNLTRYISIL